MKTFDVFKHPQQGYKAVKLGISWPAMIFGIFWLLACRLWGYAGLWLAAYLTLSLFEGSIMLDPTNLGLTQLLMVLVLLAGYLALGLVPGLKGNAWRVTDLYKHGYQHRLAVEAESAEAAISLVTQVASD